MTKARVTSVYVADDILEHIKLNPQIKNLSNWLGIKYREEFMSIEQETARLDKLAKETENCKDRIRQLKKVEDGSILPKKALLWIRTEGVSRVKRDFSIDSLLKYFNKTFNQSLNTRQFKIHLDGAKK